jgi:four helix bundle protein
MSLKGYKDLKVWSKSVDLANKIIVLVSGFPKHLVFNLGNQIIKSAISIPSNIAEGAGRNSKTEFLRFLDIAYASLCELETQITISYNAKLLALDEFDNFSKECDEIGKMINGLANSLKTDNRQLKTGN